MNRPCFGGAGFLFVGFLLYLQDTRQNNFFFSIIMKTEHLVYRAPEVEIMTTESAMPLCASALGVDPFTGQPIGNEI